MSAMGTCRDVSCRQCYTRNGTAKNRLSCSRCSASGCDVLTPTALEAHMSVAHLGYLPYRCPFCPARLGDPAKMTAHSTNHLPGGRQSGQIPYLCDPLLEEIRDKMTVAAIWQNLRRPVELSETHTTDTRANLGRQGKSLYLIPAPTALDNDESIQTFVRLVRKKTKSLNTSLKCRVCERQVDRDSSDRHIFAYHIHKYPFKCSVCWASFSEPDEALTHDHTHAMNANARDIRLIKQLSQCREECFGCETEAGKDTALLHRSLCRRLAKQATAGRAGRSLQPQPTIQRTPCVRKAWNRAVASSTAAAPVDALSSMDCNDGVDVMVMQTDGEWADLHLVPAGCETKPSEQQQDTTPDDLEHRRTQQHCILPPSPPEMQMTAVVEALPVEMSAATLQAPCGQWIRLPVNAPKPGWPHQPARRRVPPPSLHRNGLASVDMATDASAPMMPASSQSPRRITAVACALCPVGTMVKADKCDLHICKVHSSHFPYNCTLCQIGFTDHSLAVKHAVSVHASVGVRTIRDDSSTFDLADLRKQCFPWPSVKSLDPLPKKYAKVQPSTSSPGRPLACASGRADSASATQLMNVVSNSPGGGESAKQFRLKSALQDPTLMMQSIMTILAQHSSAGGLSAKHLRAMLEQTADCSGCADGQIDKALARAVRHVLFYDLVCVDKHARLTLAASRLRHMLNYPDVPIDQMISLAIEFRKACVDTAVAKARWYEGVSSAAPWDIPPRRCVICERDSVFVRFDRGVDCFRWKCLTDTCRRAYDVCHYRDFENVYPEFCARPSDVKMET